MAAMNTLLRDLRYGLRTLTRNPGFAAVAVLTIGIGIGASTTIFSWMRPMLLKPLPGATQAERIVAIENTAPDGEPITTSNLDFRDFRDNLKLVNLVTARVVNVFSVGEAPPKFGVKWCRGASSTCLAYGRKPGVSSPARNVMTHRTRMQLWLSATA